VLKSVVANRFGWLCAFFSSSVLRKERSKNDMKALKRILSTLPLVAVLTLQGAQIHNPGSPPVYNSADNSVHGITRPVERITKVVNYANRSVTTVHFQGTALLPGARGEAAIQNKQTHTDITAEFDGLVDAMRFGPEYLTYVMWAITPDGRATNLGELDLKDAKSKLNVTSTLKTFGLIVTAEPYFAVSQPSDAVVMENPITKDSVERIDEVEAKYELLPRGSYTANVSKVKPIVLEPSTPLDLYEARNAFWIALWAGAEENAAEPFATAERLLQKAEALHASRSGDVTVSTAAREAVQMAENARLLTLRHKPESQTS
jgi:hypothetical protein